MVEKTMRSFKLENIFGDVVEIEGYVTEVESDCIHIRTVDGKNICIGR